MNIHAIANNVSKLLHDSGHDAKWLAERLNVTPTTAYRWCEGARVPSIYAVYRMSKLFSVTMEDLVEGIDEETEKLHRTGEKV